MKLKMVTDLFKAILVLQENDILGEPPLYGWFFLRYHNLFAAFNSGDVYFSSVLDADEIIKLKSHILHEANKIIQQKIDDYVTLNQNNPKYIPEIEVIERFMPYDIILEVKEERIGYKEWEYNGSLDADYEVIGVEDASFVDIRYE